MAGSSKPKGFKAWTMAAPIKRADNIMSSKAAERGETGFVPSYESEPRVFMNFIMSNEYWRIWFKERGNYERDFYFKEQTRREESKIKRRFVQRNMTRKKKEKPLPIITLKRFADVAAKTEHKREEPQEKKEGAKGDGKAGGEGGS